MSYEAELLKIFGLENHRVHKIELTFEAGKHIYLNATHFTDKQHGKEVVNLLKKYKIEEIKED